MEFMGYVRPDGKVGARNYVAVIPSVTCANDVANAICHQVQGTITYLHHQGCCQMPPDLERVTDTLISLGMSPNVGAILIVSLGCEGTDHERMYKELSATGKHVEIIHIQELGGVSKAIQLGTDIARKLVIEISGLQRQPVDVSKIVMAIKCGASDTTSGMASNCVIGYVADKLVDLGATVIFGETTEFLGGEHLLARRAVNKEVADKIYEIVTNMENRAKSIGCDMRKGQPTPGNIAGGLSSIEEKSLGAIVKSGTRPIQGVLEYPQHVTDQKGLWIKDTPGREPEILTGMAATGAVVKATGAAGMMANGIVAIGIPGILVPLLIGTIMRFPQGSGTTAMITGSAIIAPMLVTLGINPYLAGLAVCLTAMCPSFLNDSYFHVVTSFSGMDIKTSLKTWTIGSILVPVFGSVIICILSLFIH